MMRGITKIAILLLCAAFTMTTLAQNSNSNITGTVQDSTGAVVPNATINLTNVGTGQQLSTTSKANGFYNFVNLSPTNYKITVTAQGFAQWVGLLTLRVSQAAQVNPRLIAASVSTHVTVSDVTPVIDRVNATLSDVKEATRLETIPLSDRSVLQVLNFTPGVVANSFGGMGGGVTRVNGIPAGSLDYLVDGQTMATRWTNELVPTAQPVPTLQEVKIITSNGNAQYSRPAIVEMVTKSGTNKFHGQLFELNQNNNLAAKGFDQTTVSYLNHNEFGGQLGGPVWIPKIYNGRNKTFFFVDLEGIRTDQNKEVRGHVPTAQWKSGDLSNFVDSNGSPVKFYDPESTTYNPVTGAYDRTQISYNGELNVIPPNRINPVAAKLYALIPDPTINVPYWQSNNLAYVQPTPIRNKLYTAKVDQLFGPNRLAMRYSYTRRTKVSSSGYILTPQTESRGINNGAIVFTQVLGPRMVNVVRAGVNYSNDLIGPNPITPPITDQVGLPAYAFNIAWPGLEWSDGFDGIINQNPSDQPDSTITASDQFSYNRGNHQFLFGFGLQNYRINTYEQGQPGGTYNFSGLFTALQDPSQAAVGTFDVGLPGTGDGLADFLLGETDSVYVPVKPHFHTRQTEYSAFAQDDWRVTPKLTLNLGIRYTYWTAFKDASGVESDFDPNVPGGMVVYAGRGPLPAQTTQAVFDAFTAGPNGLPMESAAQAGYPLSLWNMPKNNWDPRLGFAYQLDDKTVVRGGWGMYHWALPLQKYQQTARKDPPWGFARTFSPNYNDAGAAELEFPIASSDFGGPQALDAFQLGQPGTLVDTSGTESIGWNGGWEIVPMDPNYKAESVQEYNLTFARELPWHVAAQITYVGNHSTHLPIMDPINFTIPREDCTAAQGGPSCTPQNRRSFRVFDSGGSESSMTEFRWIGTSNSNALQAQLQRNFGKGLVLEVFYTWSKTLTNTDAADGDYGDSSMMVPSSLTPGFTLPIYNSGLSDSERLKLTYGPDSYLPFHTFSINGHYEFPFGRGKRFLGNAHGFVNELVSGYNISPFFYWRGGLPFAPYFTPLGSNTVLAPGKRGGELPESERTANRWFDASIAREDLGQPYTGQAFIRRANPLDNDLRNNSPKNYMTGPGFNDMDATIYKLTPVGKGSAIDIEAQIFNVFNHINLGQPNVNGVINDQVGGSRLIQLQAKYIF